jgi:hypothetical protein
LQMTKSKATRAKRLTAVPRWNILTSIVCNDHDQIVELGQITVDNMNKVPMDIEITKWYANLGNPRVRSFKWRSKVE